MARSKIVVWNVVVLSASDDVGRRSMYREIPACLELSMDLDSSFIFAEADIRPLNTVLRRKD